MRCATGILIILLGLSACGTKGALYIPTPEQKASQDSKASPRQ